MVEMVRKHFQISSKVIVAYVATKVTKLVNAGRILSEEITQYSIISQHPLITQIRKDNHTVERCYKIIKAESPEIAEVALMTICEDGLNDDTDDRSYYDGTDERADYVNADDKAEYCSLSYNQDINMERYKMEVDPNMWIMDSGSTSHRRFSRTGMTNLVQWKAPITFGKRQHAFIELKGTFKGQVFSEHGTLFSSQWMISYMLQT
jgi:hypothetical protein